jgi:hypothetical protein
MANQGDTMTSSPLDADLDGLDAQPYGSCIAHHRVLRQYTEWTDESTDQLLVTVGCPEGCEVLEFTL